MQRAIIFTLLLLVKSCILKGQSFSIQYQVKCSCDRYQCDTISTKISDSLNRIICDFEKDSIHSSATFIFKNDSLILQKNEFNNKGVFVKYNRSYYNNKNEWIADSTFDANNKLLAFKIIERDSFFNNLIVNATDLSNPSQIINQRIHKDEFNNNVSNTICYSPENCITEKYSFKGNKKYLSEIWILSPTLQYPILKESVSYIYDENGKLKMTVTNSGDKDQCESILYFYYFN